MFTRRKLVIAAALLAIVGLPIAWWLGSPLFIDQAVDEAFPFELPAAAAIDDMTPGDAESIVVDAMKTIDEAFVEALPSDQAADLEERLMKLSAMMPEHAMADEMPESGDEWAVAAEGMFRDADSFHTGSGSATIYQQGDQRVLRFEDFDVTNGPDLHVLLVENIDATGHDDLGAYLDLGSLKGNMGNQNYEIADAVDLAAFDGVMMYCQPFHVVFATAPFGG